MRSIKVAVHDYILLNCQTLRCYTDLHITTAKPNTTTPIATTHIPGTLLEREIDRPFNTIPIPAQVCPKGTIIGLSVKYVNLPIYRKTAITLNTIEAAGRCLIFTPIPPFLRKTDS